MSDRQAVGWPTGDWQRPRPSAAQQRHDLWLAALVVAGGALSTLLFNSVGVLAFGAAPSLTEQLVWMTALALPLAVRRRFPVTVVLLVAGLFIAAQARQIGDNLVPSIILFIAIYTLGAWGRQRVVARWVRVGVIVSMFGWLGLSMYQGLAGPPLDYPNAAGPLDPLLAGVLLGIGLNLLFFLTAYYFGNLAWRSAHRQHELRVQGEELRRSQSENARQAVLAERLRIARDLHDVVAHHVSVMGVQAAAARRALGSGRDSGREQASTALSTVEETARTAIGELRGLLGLLRAEPAEAGTGATEADHPAPGLDQLADLVDNTRVNGLAVTHAVYGEARPVPDAVALSAYRVVQEALTNTVKHAAASTVDVRLRFLDRDLEVEISDDGRGTGNGPGSGLGLRGMRERVAVHGGDLDVGPRRGGGFQVRARFPLSTDPDRIDPDRIDPDRIDPARPDPEVVR